MARFDPDDDRRFKELAATMRTDSGLPICFNCERPGHTKKACRLPRRKGTKFEEKFQDRIERGGGSDRSFQGRNFQERNLQDRGFQERNFQDRSFQDRSFQDRSFQDKGFQERGYQERSRDRSPISRSSRLLLERDTRPYRRPSPPSFSRSTDSFRRLEAIEAEVRCERLEDHLRKLQDEILDLRAEARSTRMVPSRPMRPMRQMPSADFEEEEDDGQLPGVVKHLAKLLRTDDDQPICFACGKPGHTRRYCYFNN